ncbi:putative signal transducing protein [Gelidibacter salicanalis]|uniref:DUF2007 domain-containing protein n=1 Tax=Gelidibacter salicanalis TaxID=291193 RepID=A0A934KZK3_9FLAO|nr:DUF2007 domain-containing protein [Gelidibacter salicanalis]MBJ7882460.1 DUF2007 domain-containing protein [Gelidibacter salicanalis]
MSDVKIYSGSSQVRIMEIKNILENENIDYQELNKSDSSYPGIYGDIEIYVAEADAEKAQLILASSKS